jgi:hypothetical protein
MAMKNTVFWAVTPCRLVRTCCLGFLLAVLWIWRRCFLPICRALSKLKGVTTQKTVRFITKIIKSRNMFYLSICLSVCLSVCLSIYLWLYSPCGPWSLFQFLTLYTIGRTPLTGFQPVARPLSTHRTTWTQNKRTQTSMPRVGFESTTPVFERAKTVRALGRAATEICSTTCKFTNVPKTLNMYFVKILS